MSVCAGCITLSIWSGSSADTNWTQFPSWICVRWARSCAEGESHCPRDLIPAPTTSTNWCALRFVSVGVPQISSLFFHRNIPIFTNHLLTNVFNCFYFFQIVIEQIPLEWWWTKRNRATFLPFLNENSFEWTAPNKNTITFLITNSVNIYYEIYLIKCLYNCLNSFM